MSQMENVSSNLLNIGGGGTFCIGNGQVHDAISPSYEVCKTLNCMDDPMKILIVRNDDIQEDSTSE